MLEKCTKAVLTMIALCVPLTANAERFFCEVTEFVIIDADGTNEFADKKFILDVLPNGISFKSDGYFENVRARIDLWDGYNEWSARSVNSLNYTDAIYRFGDGFLHASVVMVKQITSVRARCENDQ